jgi:hypothetical protein
VIPDGYSAHGSVDRKRHVLNLLPDIDPIIAPDGEFGSVTPVTIGATLNGRRRIYSFAGRAFKKKVLASRKISV